MFVDEGILYMAQDRCDLQHSVKCLASYMAKPTEVAVKCLQQILLCVRGAENLSFILRYSGKRGTMMEVLYRLPQGEQLEEEERGEEEETRSTNPELFANPKVRSGIGGLKHIDLRVLWLQRGVKRYRFKIRPTSTKLNIADLNTKKMSVQRRKFVLFLIGAGMDERGREVPVGAEEMAEHMSAEALRHQIRCLKSVGRTTKNRGLLFTTCLIQMVMGSKGQPREFTKETYVYVKRQVCGCLY